MGCVYGFFCMVSGDIFYVKWVIDYNIYVLCCYIDSFVWYLCDMWELVNIWYFFYKGVIVFFNVILFDDMIIDWVNVGMIVSF